jgi:drug/metabolite transporter (DMT)-like permease
MIYIPIFSALALAAGTILEKINLKNKKVNIKFYQVLEFGGILVAMLPLIFFFWKIDNQAFQLKNILIFSSVILFSIFANLFTYYSIKGEKVSNLEPAKLLEPLFITLLAIAFSFIFSGGLFERNFKVIIPSFIAAGALIFSHIERKHLKFNKYFLAAIAGSFFFALELVISRLILDFYSPISFYFLRCLFVFLISIVLFKSSFKKLDKKYYLSILLIGIIWVAYRVILYFGYQNYGVFSTNLFMMLSPMFIYTFARIFLKEKLKAKNIIAAIIIIACIVYSALA